MANEIIRPSELPVRTNPVPSEVVPSDNNVTVAGVSWEDGVNSAVPPASQSESEAGVINSKRMTPLTTKQAIDAQVPPKISAAIGALNLGSASQASVGDFATAAEGSLASSAVQPNDPALVPAGGSTSQVLTKSSNTDYDTEWTTSAAATAVSYAPQVLTDEQKLQAQSNISLANFKTVQILLDDTSLAYAGDPGKVQVGPGDVIEAGGFRYEVAASDAVDWHVETAGGVRLNVLGDALRPEMLGLSASAGVDQQAGLQKLLDINSPEIYLPSGVWRSDGDLTRNTDIVLTGPGTLDFSNGSGKLLITGSVTEIDALSANMTKHSRTLQWAAGQDLSAGDIIILWNEDDNSWGGPNSYSKDGAMFRLFSVDGASAQSFDIAVDPYVAADFRVFKMNPVSVTIDGPTFKVSDTSVTHALQISYASDVSIRNVKGETGGIYGLFRVDRSYGVRIDGLTPVHNGPLTNNQYGIIVTHCNHVTITGSTASATRHAVMIGGDNLDVNIPTRHIKVTGMTLLNSSLLGAGESHSIGDFISYEGCTFMTGCNPGGRNMSVRNSTIFSAPDYAPIYGAPVGGTLMLENLHIVSEYDGQTNGFIHIRCEGNMREDLNVVIRNITADTPNPGALAKLVYVQAPTGGPMNKKCNALMDGVNWNAPSGWAFLYGRELSGGPFKSDYFIVDNVSGPAGAAIISPHATTDAVPRREMQQVGSVVTSCASGQAQASSANQTFRYPYSKTPTIVGSSQTSVTGSSKASWGGKRVNTFPNILTREAITLVTQTLDTTAFSSTENIRQHWAVGIAEI